MKHKKLAALALLVLAAFATGCAGSPKPAQPVDSQTAKKTQVVCVNFAAYDFLRQTAGDAAQVTMLLAPGTEAHSYEPSPKDILTIQNSDLFVYTGGESDVWVQDILDAMDHAPATLRMMDCVEPMEEQHTEGMQAEAGHEEGESEEAELDEHVWTSPVNAMAIVRQAAEALAGQDAAHAEEYRTNAEAYAAKLAQLNEQFLQVVAEGARTEIIVGDRFPFGYFCREYGLTCYAAFPGCSTDTEPSAATVAFLIDKVKSDGIPVVFHLELSNEKMCDAICEATGAASVQLNAVHNVSAADFAAGATYLSLMEQNVEALRQALA